jgi:integrase
MMPPKSRFYLPLFILLALYIGQRKSTNLQLRWSQVDLTAERIDFRTTQRAHSNKPRPRIRIPKKLLGHLKRARQRCADLGFVLNVDGEHIGDIKRALRPPVGTRNSPTSPAHASAHLCNVADAGWVDLCEASGFLGMSRETLENIYGHHSPQYLRKAAKALS